MSGENIRNVKVTKHEERIIGFYSASGGNDGPSVENWKSNKGEVQVFKVRMSPSLLSTLMQTEANKGSATVDGRVGCPNYPKIRPQCAQFFIRALF